MGEVDVGVDSNPKKGENRQKVTLKILLTKKLSVSVRNCRV